MCSFAYSLAACFLLAIAWTPAAGGAAPLTPPAAAPPRRVAPPLYATVFTRGRPSEPRIQAFLSEQRTKSFNHPFVGATRLGCGGAVEAPRWAVNEFGAVVGHGQLAYSAAAEALQTWNVMEGVGWAGVSCEAAGGGDKDGVGRGVATVAQTFAKFLWVLNPCRQVYADRDLGVAFPPGLEKFLPAGSAERFEGEGGGRRGSKDKLSQIAYATVEGHLLRGEERLLVAWDGKERGPRGRGGGEVRFEVYSISSGAPGLGQVLFPLVAPMQRRYFQAQVDAMKLLVRKGVQQAPMP